MKLPAWFSKPPPSGREWWILYTGQLVAGLLCLAVAWKHGSFFGGALWGALIGATLHAMLVRRIVEHLTRSRDEWRERAMGAHEFIVRLGSTLGAAERGREQERDFTQAN